MAGRLSFGKRFQRKSRLARRAGRISTAARSRWLRFENLEARRLLTTSPSLTFSPGDGVLSLATDPGAHTAEIAISGSTGLVLTLDGQDLSSAAAQAGATAANIRSVQLSGGGSGDQLLVDSVTTSDPLSLTSDGTLQINGNVTATDVTISAPYFTNLGQVHAQGQIVVQASDVLNAGTLSASSSDGAGGSIDVQFTDSYVDTSGALAQAAGTGGAGGSVTIDGGSTGRLFSSGRFDATGSSGGAINLLGQNVLLVAAQVDASGTAGTGGLVRIGGDFEGANADVPDAQTTLVTAAATIRADGGGGGSGGRVVVWSQTTTTAEGTISAYGAGGGQGGLVEVSSHGELIYSASVDAGAGGQLLLDPEDLTITSSAPTVSSPVTLTAPTSGGTYGDYITVLTNGNVVVTNSTLTVDSNANAGAVYLFNGATGALISTLTGSHAGDRIGAVGDGATGEGNGYSNGVTALTNGNFVVSSTSWNGDEGAATWGSGTTGVSGSVSASNSLVGSSTGDSVGTVGVVDDLAVSGITALTNGNFVVESSDWGGGEGAATFGNGTTGAYGPSGVFGAVSSANSLVGTSSTDNVGYSLGSGYNNLTALPNGDYVVLSPGWASNKGAATWANGNTGIAGTISSSNSLVGVTGDSIADGGIIVLTYSNYVIISPNWNSNRGAVTWVDGANGETSNDTNSVSSGNSLVGSNVNDGVGGNGGVALTNGNYVVADAAWDNSAGAVTWVNGSNGETSNDVNTISSTNSLIGTAANDEVGVDGAHALSNGNYVTADTNWNNNEGAATWGNGSTGTAGDVGTGNSITGGAADESVGGWVIALTNGNYVVASPEWNNSFGAATWASGSAPTSEVVSATNSLVGSHQFDDVADGPTSVTPLTNGNYVVNTEFWNNGAGAATWGNGTIGISGTVSGSNSLIGSSSTDSVSGGGVFSLSDGNYVVDSFQWSGNKGAVTWGNGNSGITGSISSGNSLVGSSAGDQVGNAGVVPLSDSNYVVDSPNFSSSDGAATFGDGTTGITGTISSGNSIIGASSSAAVIGVQVGTVAGSYVVQYAPGAEKVLVVYDPLNPNSITYSDQPSTNISIAPGTLTATLDVGTDVVLQANNDITVSSPIIVSASDTAGNLSLEAGRSILLDADITTDNGNLTLLANDSAAHGVQNADRLSGNAVITMASGVTLNTGTGTLSINLANGTDKTYNAAGVVTLLDVTASNTTLSTASTLGVTINGTTAGDGTASTYTQSNITGPINLNDSSLAVVNNITESGSDSFTIISATGTIDGTFSNGTTVTAQDGTLFTIHYNIHTVVLTPASTVATLVVTAAPTNRSAGQTTSVTITAEDAMNDVVTGFADTVSLTDSLGGASFGSVSFSSGIATVTATLDAAGTQTITASDSSASVSGTSNPVTVTPAAASKLLVIASPTNLSAGSTTGVTITAEDQFNNIVTGFSNSVSLADSLGGATFGSVSFSNGKATAAATLDKARTQTITASDTSVGTVTAGTSNSVTVSPAAASRLLVTASLTNLSAGSTTSVTITAEDQFNNIVTGFGNSVTLADSLGGATFGSASFSNGLATVTATLDTAGTQTITTSDTPAGTITAGTSNPVTVTPAAASKLLVTASPTNLSAGSTTGVTITAEDKFNNLITGFGNSISLVDSLSGATFGNATFSGGVATVTATLDKAGTQTITASDTPAGTITAGTSNPVTVTPAAASELLVSASPGSLTAGNTTRVSITAEDQFSNIVTGFGDSVSLADSLGGASFGSASFSGGLATVTATLDTAGTQTIAASDITTGTVSAGTSGPVTVTPAAASKLLVTASPTSLTAAPTTSATITAEDQFNNIVMDFSDSVSLADSLGGASFGSASFSGGMATVTATLDIVGTQTIAATDTTTGTVSAGTSSPITVTPAAGTQLTISSLPTFDVSLNAGVFSAIGANPNVNVTDLYNALVNNAHVVVTDSALMNVDDSILWESGANLSGAEIPSGHTLTIETAPTATSGNLSIASTVNVPGDILLSGNSVSLNGSVNAGGTLWIHSAGAVVQSAPLTAASLSLAASGNVSLTAANNVSGTLAIHDAAFGAYVEWLDADGFTVGAIAAASAAEDPQSIFGAVAGVSASGNFIALENTSGNLLLGDGGANEGVTATGTGGDVRLESAGQITQNSAGDSPITAGALGIVADGNVELSQTPNTASLVSIDNSSGYVRFVDSEGFTVGSVGAVSPAIFPNAVHGVTTVGGDIGLQTDAGSIQLGSGNASEVVSATGAGGDVRLKSAGSIYQIPGSGAITAAAFAVVADGNVDLSQSPNTATLVAMQNSSGFVRFVDSEGFTVGTVGGINAKLDPNTLHGLSTVGGDIGLQTIAGSILLGNGNASEVVSATGSGGDVRLDSAGAIMQNSSAGGAITAGALGIVADGNVDLSQSPNTVLLLAASDSSGFVRFVNSISLAVGSVGGASSQVFPNAVHGVTTVDGDIALQTNSGSLQLGEGNSSEVVSATSAGGDVRLESAGSVYQSSGSGAITAAAFGVVAAGTIQLSLTTNFVSAILAIDDTAAGAVSFNNSDAFAQGTVGAISSKIFPHAITGVTTVGNDVHL